MPESTLSKVDVDEDVLTISEKSYVDTRYSQLFENKILSEKSYGKINVALELYKTPASIWYNQIEKNESFANQFCRLFLVHSRFAFEFFK